MNLFHGLPTHVLLVHVVVVLIPLTALALVTAALWPRAARQLGPLLPLLALAALGSVPLTTHAGEWLERHVDDDALVRRHTELGDGLLPWAVALFVAAAVVWWVGRLASAERAEGSRPRWSALPVRIVIGVLSLAVAVGAVVDVYRIGDSGAKAAWHDAYSKTETGDHDEDGS
ncbi:DUF2231 domain-containing protein [Streptomyces sp. NK08204]|uniref:DUF2231 domain-containing protein n=1 Tax=Streptomyces sp. NK08204 TaxID=2873260 RepID=UPI001CECA7B1|nr:DUF2231 domain-containing protein [Streptomyces sp. NK08204]